MPAPDAPEMRVLVLAPTGRDAANSISILTKAGIACAACRDVPEVCEGIVAGAAVLILTEESLAQDRVGQLAEALSAQPPWSDFPIVLLTRGGPESPAATRAMRTLGNVMLLERPVRVFTLVTAATTALRARAKQYQIRAQLDDLRSADARKNEFLATLAHELRNPLAPVRTGLQILRISGDLRGAAAETRDMMERQIGHMTRLIDDLMDVSRITRGKVVLKREFLDFRRVLDSALELSRAPMEAAGHAFTATLPDRPLPLDGDATRLAQIVANLLNNAAEYTPDGGRIDLSVGIERETVVIRVRDDGVGIPADMLPVVFEMFAQVGRSIDRAQGGLGIGLTLVRSLVELHGGTIAAESAGAGQGSTFTVTLPLAEAAIPVESPPPQASGGPPSRRRILVVDDNVDGAESLAMMLEFDGHETATAHAGPAALQAAADFRPDVIFLDIGLPGMNGYEVAESLRGRGSAAVLVALTGWGSEDDKRRAREAGFDFHLTKPAEAAEVGRLLTGMKPRG